MLAFRDRINQGKFIRSYSNQSCVVFFSFLRFVLPIMLIQSIHMFSCGESISSAGIHLFREFLRTEFSDENIEFWLICEDFRNSCGSKKLQSKAQKIFNEFVAVQSKREVTIVCIVLITFNKLISLGGPCWNVYTFFCLSIPEIFSWDLQEHS